MIVISCGICHRLLAIKHAPEVVSPEPQIGPYCPVPHPSQFGFNLAVILRRYYDPQEPLE